MASKRLMGRRTLALLFSLVLVIGLVVPASYAVGADEVDNTLADYELVAVQGAGIKTADSAADQDLRFYTTLMADVENFKTDFGADEVTITEYGTIFKPTQKLAVDEALTLESEGIAVAKATGSWSDADLPEGFYAVLSDSADGVHAGVRVTARSYVTFAMESIGGTIEKTVYGNNNDEDTIINGQASRSVYMVARAMLTAIQEHAEEIAAMDVTINWTDAVKADSDPANVAGADILAFLSGNVEAAEVLPTLPIETVVLLDDFESYADDAALVGSWDDCGYQNEGSKVTRTGNGRNGTVGLALQRKTSSISYSMFTLDRGVKVTNGDTFSFWFWHNDSVVVQFKLVFYDASGVELGTYAPGYCYYPTNTDREWDLPRIQPSTWTRVKVPLTFNGTIAKVRFFHEHGGSSVFKLDDIYVLRVVTKEEKPEQPIPAIALLEDAESYADNAALVGSWDDCGYENEGSKVTLSNGGGRTGNALALQKVSSSVAYTMFTLDEPVTVAQGDTFSFWFFHTEDTAAQFKLVFYDANGAELGSYAPGYCYYPNNTDREWDLPRIEYRTWTQVNAPIEFDGTVAKVRFFHEHYAEFSVYKIDDIYILRAADESSGTWKQKQFYLSCALNPWVLEDIKAYKECGYNLVECRNFQLTHMEECMDACETVGGVDVLFNQKSSIQLPYADGFNATSVHEVVNKYKGYDSLLGYLVWDEITPGQNNKNYTLAKGMLNYLDSFDPASLKYMLLLPSYGLEYTWANGNYDDYVENYIRTMKPQVLSFDYYPYVMGHEGHTSNWWRDMGLFRKKSLEYNLPFWYYYQACKVNDTGPTPTEEEIKYQMYVGLAYGAKYLCEWNGQWDGVYGAFYVYGGKTPQYDTIKARNAELRPIGEYLFDKTSQYIYHLGSAASYGEDFYLDNLSQSDIIKSATVKKGIASSGDAIISVFTDGKTDAKYLLVVNKNTDKALYSGSKITLKETKNISYFDPATRSEVSIGSGTSIDLSSLSAGGGKLYVLK